MDPFPSEEIRLAFIAFFFPHPPLRSVHLFTQVERLPQFSIALRRVDGNLQFVEPQDPRFLFAFPPGRLHRNVLSRKEERREQDKPPTPQKKIESRRRHCFPLGRTRRCPSNYRRSVGWPTRNVGQNV